MPVRKTQVTLTGEITGTDWPTLFDRAVQGCLETTGSIIAKKMKEETSKHDSSGLLTGSITWQTKSNGSEVESPATQNDKIDPPEAKNELLIGSNARHAAARETGSGRHINPEGSEEFIANLKDWFRREIGLDPDGPPEERGRFWAMVTYIRNNGTAAAPYIEPFVEDANSILLESWRVAYAAMVKKYAKKRG